MSWLNYTHLRAFWATVREGGVSAASRALHVSQPTISSHLKTLETSVGKPLLERGRGAPTLTESGRVMYRYADEIFRLGAELEGSLRGNRAPVAQSLKLGIADVVPKSVAHHIIQPALKGEYGRVLCYEGKPAELLGRLVREQLDAVIADTPVDPHHHVNAFNHLLGESGMTIFAPPADARRYRTRFPQSLDGAPFLLPADNTSMRRELERWFSANDIHPDIRAEFEDMALLKTFAADGLGVFALPTVVEQDVRRQCSAHVVGRVEEVRERFYVITLERRVRHKAINAIVQRARTKLFS